MSTLGFASAFVTTVLLLAESIAAQPPSFDERRRSVINTWAYPKGPGEPGYLTIAAKLWLREDPEWCSRRLERLLAEGPQGDMFWMYPVTSIAYLDRGQLSESARKALRTAWRTYAPYRGDTENHFLLYYTCLYLMAQLWPGEDGSTWYTGKSSEENLREAQAWIESWIKLTTTRGQGEYDSTHYMGVFLLPMSYLAEWAKDPALKKRATMMIEYLMADYAAENLDGVFVGSHSRSYDNEVIEPWASVSSDFGWALFGLGGHLSTPSGFLAYYLLASGYEPPEVLKRIASDRSKPYTHYERKRTRNRWRFQSDRRGPVYKTTYVRREYAVSSDQGGVLQPIQQHSWDLTWAVPDGRGVHNTLFTLHPYSSLEEVQTYFVFGPDFATEAVVRSKKTYDSPDKLIGGSPHEKIFQDMDTVIALYNIPPGTRFPHINGFFSKDLTQLHQDASGWIFARGGDAWIACRPLQSHSWQAIVVGGRRLLSPYLKNGIVLQVAAASEYPTLDSFRRAILALPLDIRLEPKPTVRLRSLRGRDLEFTYGDVPKVNGIPLDYERWPLFGGPFLEADVDSERLVMKHGSLRRVLDFRRVTIEDGVGP